MNDKITKAEKTAAKHAERLRKLQAEIAAREASGRKTKALARARAALPYAEQRAAAAAARAQAMVTAAAAKAARVAAIDAPMNRRLDRIAAAAPAIMKRWKHERAEEPNRIAKRTKHLRRVTTMDLRPDSSVRRDRPPPPVIEASTFPSGPIIPFVPPKMEALDRVGLLPGDYRLVDAGPNDYDAFQIPKQWTAAYVGKRMADAHATLRRLPMSTRPKEFGGIWPEYSFAAGELAIQAGAGTLTLGRNRIIGGTSSADVVQMDEALAWAMQFLSHRPVQARALNKWAYWSQIDGDTPDRFVDEALEHIAKSLNAKDAPVT